MKGLLFYINKLLGRAPTKVEKTFAQKELEFFMRAKYPGLRRFVRKGERFNRPYKKKTEEKIGDEKVVGRFYRIIDDKEGKNAKS